MNKLFYLSIALLLILPMVSADLGTFQQGKCVNIKTILNTTSVNISTISYPNSTLVISNQVMTKIGQTFNYTFCNTSAFGVYLYDYFDTEGNVYVNSFTINGSGQEYSTSTGILYFLLLVGLSVIFFYFINKMTTTDDDYGWKVGYGLGAYIVAIVIAFVSWSLANNYLYDIPFLASVLQLIWIVLGVMLPIVLILVAFSLLKEQAKEATIQRKQRYGYSRAEASR